MTKDIRQICERATGEYVCLISFTYYREGGRSYVECGGWRWDKQSPHDLPQTIADIGPTTAEIETAREEASDWFREKNQDEQARREFERCERWDRARQESKERA
jgi:hypothetical protein